MMSNNIAADQLRLLIERIERLEEEKKGIGDDIKDAYGEAKATGYDVKIMRQLIRLRKLPPRDRQEMEAILQTYLAALGME
nr:GapR family DNA-binding domain-containing protein [Sphingobium sp. B11D3A]